MVHACSYSVSICNIARDDIIVYHCIGSWYLKWKLWVSWMNPQTEYLVSHHHSHCKQRKNPWEWFDAFLSHLVMSAFSDEISRGIYIHVTTQIRWASYHRCSDHHSLTDQSLLCCFPRKSLKILKFILDFPENSVRFCIMMDVVLSIRYSMNFQVSDILWISKYVFWKDLYSSSLISTDFILSSLNF